MITDVMSFTIVVRDQDEALRYYAETCGFEKRAATLDRGTSVRSTLGIRYRTKEIAWTPRTTSEWATFTASRPAPRRGPVPRCR